MRCAHLKHVGDCQAHQAGIQSRCQGANQRGQAGYQDDQRAQKILRANTMEERNPGVRLEGLPSGSTDEPFPITRLEA